MGHAGFRTPGETVPGESDGRAPRPRALCALAYMGCVDRLDPAAARLIQLLHADQVVIGGASELAIEGVSSGVIEARLPDPLVSSAHAVLERQGHVWQLRDCGSRNGTFVEGKSIATHDLRDGDVFETGRTFWRYLEYRPLQPALFPPTDFVSFGPTRTVCPALMEDLSLLQRAALGLSHVMILGETGTGKEVATDDMHAASGRSGRLLKVNCAGLAPDRAGGELFGWLRGAFTGADRDHEGYIEAASGGTLFLDEIGTLAPGVQAMLLRVVEDHRVTRLSETRSREVDLRVVSATNSDLPSMLGPGGFRNDLYARLAQVSLRMPPLRERREDLLTLVAHHLRGAGVTRVSPEAARLLLAQPWPENIRGLFNALGSALLVAGDTLRPEHFRPALVPPSEARGPDPEAAALRADLVRFQGNVAGMARARGVHPTQLRRELKKHGLEASDYRRTPK